MGNGVGETCWTIVSEEVSTSVGLVEVFVPTDEVLLTNDDARSPWTSMLAGMRLSFRGDDDVFSDIIAFDAPVVDTGFIVTFHRSPPAVLSCCGVIFSELILAAAAASSNLSASIARRSFNFCRNPPIASLSSLSSCRIVRFVSGV